MLHTIENLIYLHDALINFKAILQPDVHVKITLSELGLSVDVSRDGWGVQHVSARFADNRFQIGRPKSDTNTYKSTVDELFRRCRIYTTAIQK